MPRFETLLPPALPPSHLLQTHSRSKTTVELQDNSLSKKLGTRCQPVARQQASSSLTALTLSSGIEA